MKPNLKLLFTILFINLLSQNQIKAWIRCWNGKVSMNLKLLFYTGRDDFNATVENFDINVYETYAFSSAIISVLSFVNMEKKVPYYWTLPTTCPVSALYGFSVFGEVSYKMTCKPNKRNQIGLCSETMKFGIPDNCLHCYGKPRDCIASINLYQKLSLITPYP